MSAQSAKTRRTLTAMCIDEYENLLKQLMKWLPVGMKTLSGLDENVSGATPKTYARVILVSSI